jgi:HAD superfamily hydrolase (TIGR01459 family)
MTAANSNRPRALRGLEDVAPFYDGFILDLWGVVHDGVKPLPGAIDTLKELKRAKRIVWLLSNAPRRTWVVIRRLSEMGIAEDLYDGALTSGEACWRALRDKYLEQWGGRCFHLGPREKDASLTEDLALTLADAPGEADFVLNSGPVSFDDGPDAYEPVLEACLGAGLPMLCANPDRVVHVEERLVVCAGTLAEFYEQRGGNVTYFGKPHRGVYSQCLAAMGVQKVLAVGDGMQTDIAGAAGAGLDSALVAAGIHRDELGLGPAVSKPGPKDAPNFDNSPAGIATGSRLQDMLQKYPYRPDYLLPRFSW